MLDFAYGFLARSAVIVPTLIAISAGLWLALHKLGVMRSNEPFNASDMRTWPLAYSVGDAALFGVIFAAISAAIGDGELSAAISAGVAALIALGPFPAMLARLRK
jgi:hypothetical protein